MSDPNSPNRFNEEKATYAVRGEGTPDLDAGVAATDCRVIDDQRAVASPAEHSARLGIHDQRCRPQGKSGEDAQREFARTHGAVAGVGAAGAGPDGSSDSGGVGCCALAGRRPARSIASRRLFMVASSMPARRGSAESVVDHVTSPAV